MYFWVTYTTIEKLTEKLRRAYAPAKSVCLLQGKLGNTFMQERLNVLSYAARIEGIADGIEDAHRQYNGGRVDNSFRKISKER